MLNSLVDLSRSLEFETVQSRNVEWGEREHGVNVVHFYDK